MDEIRKRKQPDPDRWTISPDMAFQLSPLLAVFVLVLVARVASLVTSGFLIGVLAGAAGLVVVVFFLWRKLRYRGRCVL